MNLCVFTFHELQFVASNDNREKSYKLSFINKWCLIWILETHAFGSCSIPKKGFWSQGAGPLNKNNDYMGSDQWCQISLMKNREASRFQVPKIAKFNYGRKSRNNYQKSRDFELPRYIEIQLKLYKYKNRQKIAKSLDMALLVLKFQPFKFLTDSADCSLPQKHCIKFSNEKRYGFFDGHFFYS